MSFILLLISAGVISVLVITMVGVYADVLTGFETSGGWVLGDMSPYIGVFGVILIGSLLVALLQAISSKRG